eukprot:gnl/Spiro4/13785_TR7357_c0_g1_i1.p2 gnl/Spiro4/13785_TR7357_c0_g1~~gnl/Spiro4/13785_TR7357_c0_g1_i1.p2  ORF type:complete len:112 (+),score=31.48 gnl/Spiro4/13785_TR7357_c0_g1_i1:249-584(+)
MVLAIVIPFGIDYVRPYLPRVVVEYAEHFRANPRFIIASVVLLNFLSGQLLATGAFEVSYGGELLHSKIETGRLPAMQDIFTKLTLRGVTVHDHPTVKSPHYDNANIRRAY